MASVTPDMVTTGIPPQPSASTWIGAKRTPGNQSPAPGTWEWTDGTSWSFTNWANGEPSHVVEECACIREGLSDTWNDQPCHALKAFICQKMPGIVTDYVAKKVISDY